MTYCVDSGRLRACVLYLFPVRHACHGGLPMCLSPVAADFGVPLQSLMGSVVCTDAGNDRYPCLPARGGALQA